MKFLEDHIKDKQKIEHEIRVLQHKIRELEEKSKEYCREASRDVEGFGYFVVGGFFDGRIVFLNMDHEQGYRIEFPSESTSVSTGDEDFSRVDESHSYRVEFVTDRRGAVFRLLVCLEITSFNGELFEYLVQAKRYDLHNRHIQLKEIGEK